MSKPKTVSQLGCQASLALEELAAEAVNQVAQGYRDARLPVELTDADRLVLAAGHLLRAVLSLRSELAVALDQYWRASPQPEQLAARLDRGLLHLSPEALRFVASFPALRQVPQGGLSQLPGNSEHMDFSEA